jgi:hypothetical protein
MEKRVTKKENFETLRGIVEDSTVENKDELVAFIDAQIALVESKAEKAKERAAAKKAEGDELRATIKSILTDELQTVDMITDQIDDEEITKAKVVARLSQLVKLGEAEKEQVKVEDKKVMAYKIVAE